MNNSISISINKLIKVFTIYSICILSIFYWFPLAVRLLWISNSFTLKKLFHTSMYHIFALFDKLGVHIYFHIVRRRWYRTFSFSWFVGLLKQRHLLWKLSFSMRTIPSRVSGVLLFSMFLKRSCWLLNICWLFLR